MTRTPCIHWALQCRKAPDVLAADMGPSAVPAAGLAGALEDLG